MKTQKSSIVDEVALEVTQEMRAHEEVRQQQEDERKERVRARLSSLEGSVNAIIPNLLALLIEDEKFGNLLCETQHHHFTRIPSGEYDLISASTLRKLRKDTLSKMTIQEREKHTQEIRQKRKYTYAHRKILNLFKRIFVIKNGPCLEDICVDRGIKIASFVQHDMRVGRAIYEEYKAKIYYHIILVLRRGRLEINFFRPHYERGGGLCWGEAIPLSHLPLDLDPLISSLGQGGRAMVKTIMTKRADVVCDR